MIHLANVANLKERVVGLVGIGMLAIVAQD